MPLLPASDDELLDELVKQAEAGDPQAQEYLQKIATEMYEAGQSAALEEVHKTASEEFLKGAGEVQVLVYAAQQ